MLLFYYWQRHVEWKNSPRRFQMAVTKKLFATIIIVCLTIYCSILYIALYLYYRNIRSLCIPTLIFNISFVQEYNSCPVRYENKELIGNSLVSILAQKEECCEFCEKAEGCKGFTWTNERNGLCVLKSDIRDFVDKMGVHSGIGPEPPGYFLPYAQDNTTPLDDTKLIKIIPHNGCNSATKLIVGIRSAPTEFDRRNWVRQTWAKVRSKATKVIFVIANHKENDVNFQVRTERKFYDDILLLDYDDSYYNMSLKNYGYYEYVIKHCPNADCVLKVDSDTVVNLSGFEKLCAVSSENVSMLTGDLYYRSPVVRDTNSKWYVPRYVYDKKFYPLYPNGFAQFITGRGTLQKLQDTLRTKTPFLASENFRRLPDDAIYQGDVVELAGIQLQDVGGISLYGVSYWSDASNGYQKIPLATLVSDDSRTHIWSQMQYRISSNKKKSSNRTASSNRAIPSR